MGYIIKKALAREESGVNNMPLVRLSMYKGKTIKEKNKIVNLVHKSMIDSLKIPENDKNFRIMEYKEENFIIPKGKSKNYLLIEISMFKGRSLGAKRVLYKHIAENLKQIGFDPLDVFIVLYEEDMDNWGIRGGHPASEINLGFNVKV